MRNILPENKSQSTQDYSKLLGTPYRDKDCWGIVVEFYKIVFNYDLKSYYDEIPTNRDIAKSLIYSSMGDFVSVDEKDILFGDILLIKLYGVESHIAVYLGEEKMLHSTLHSGCVIERTPKWKHLIVGYYRVNNK
jgi:cell wall-associated NlpC family hydrolase